MCLGIPGRIVEIVDAEDQRAVADVDGVRREVSVALLGIRQDDGEIIGQTTDGEEPITVGDWVLIHVGFAMSKIDEAEAAETLRALKMFDEQYEQEMDEYSADTYIDPLEYEGIDPRTLTGDGEVSDAEIDPLGDLTGPAQMDREIDPLAATVPPEHPKGNR